MNIKLTKLLFGLLFALICMSCDDILEVPDISNQTVTLFAPAPGTILTNNTVSFNWDIVEDATGYRFQLAIPDFENTQQLVLDSIVTVDSLNNITTSLRQSLLNGNYTWRIKAVNSGFETPYTTAPFQVNGDENADITPPNTPQLLTPVNDTTFDETTVSFEWSREDVPGTAERDSIFFFSDEMLQNQVGSNLGANKTFTADFSSGTFYWLVRAFDTAGNESEDSEVFNFTVN